MILLLIFIVLAYFWKYMITITYNITKQVYDNNGLVYPRKRLRSNLWTAVLEIFRSADRRKHA